MKDLRFVDLFGHCTILVITKFIQQRSKSKTHLMMAILVKPRSFPVLSEREANGQELARSSRGNKIHS